MVTLAAPATFIGKTIVGGDQIMAHYDVVRAV